MTPPTSFEVIKVVNGYMVIPGASQPKIANEPPLGMHVFPSWHSVSQWLHQAFEPGAHALKVQSK